jgi:FAD/FMN-containing dehydrogenase
MDQSKVKSMFTGPVVLPEDAAYDETREVFYGGIDKKPAVIIRVAGAEDIKQAILLAKEQQLELAVRSGGHSVAGYSTTDGGIVIDLRDMRKLELDVSKKTVWAETGLTAKDVTDELDTKDLALGFGDTGSVGIGGITLGGGVGFLARKFGLAIDNLLAAEVVTADGEVLKVDDKNHSDLFWALKGGGGNFGVVTKFKYRLHDLAECYGGLIFLPATAEVIAGFTKVASEAPDELSTIGNVMPIMPLPFIPEEHHGKLAVMALIMYAGDPKEGEKVLAPIKALAEPYVDMTKPMRYKDIFFPEQAGFHPKALSKNMHIDKIDTAVADQIIEGLGDSKAPMKALQFRVLGGAMARVADDATAYAHRQNPIMLNVATFYETEAEKADRQQWVDDYAQALRQDTDAAYVGFLGPNEQDRLLDAYPDATLKRLKSVKQQYDPENLFRSNFNILP